MRSVYLTTICLRQFSVSGVIAKATAASVTATKTEALVDATNKTKQQNAVDKT